MPCLISIGLTYQQVGPLSLKTRGIHNLWLRIAPIGLVISDTMCYQTEPGSHTLYQIHIQNGKTTKVEIKLP